MGYNFSSGFLYLVIVPSSLFLILPNIVHFEHSDHTYLVKYCPTNPAYQDFFVFQILILLLIKVEINYVLAYDIFHSIVLKCY